jgi:hypothetical protein
LGGDGGHGGDAGKKGDTGHPGYDGLPGDGGHDNGDLATAQAPGNGGVGGEGGAGGNGAGNNIVPAIDITYTIGANVDKVTVHGTVSVIGGSGNDGGEGGNEGRDAEQATGPDRILGGKGGGGGDGGDGGGMTIHFVAPLVVLTQHVLVKAGDGGDGGSYGTFVSDYNRAAIGGDGGDGAQSAFVADTDLLLDGTNATVVVDVTAGNGGEFGGLTDPQQQPQTPQGGDGGTGIFTVGRDAKVRHGAILNVDKGDAKDSTVGNVQIEVDRNLELEAGSTFNLNIDTTDAVMNATTGDSISFGTLLLWEGSTFTTAATVFSDASSATGEFYQVTNLDAITHATWITAGFITPDSNGLDPDYMRFNMKDIAPNAVILDMGGTGTVNLSRFNPMSQQNDYLTSPNRPAFADDPANWDYTGEHFFDDPAFITSPYQTKRLHLGNVVLIDRIDYASVPTGPATLVVVDAANGRTHYVSSGSALWPLYDDFAYTSGLRRYYWDVYAQDGGAQDSQLIAYNYYTADASKIYAQAAAASGIAVNQTFQASMAAIDNAFRHGLVDHYHVEAAFSGSHTRTDTGSHVDVDNWSGALALSRKSENTLGQTIFGIFGEFSTGKYDTFTQVPRYGDLTGDGDVRTYGGGIFLKNLFPTNTLLEASVRGGGFRNEFRLTKDPWIQHPGIHNGDTDGTYIGGHIGVAQRIDVIEDGQLEAYGRYFVTRTHSDTFRTPFGDQISIDAFTSSRVRVGGRWTQTLPTDTLQLYFGLAFEHEFDGKVTGKNGPDPFLHTVETTGSSGFGELGLNFNPMDNLTLSVGAFGWAGQQKGAGGNAAVNFSF